MPQLIEAPKNQYGKNPQYAAPRVPLAVPVPRVYRLTMRDYLRNTRVPAARVIRSGVIRLSGP